MQRAKKITFILLIMALCVCLFACNKKVEESQDEPTAHEHTYGEWVTDKGATCTEDGSKHRECSCGDKQTSVITKLGHEYEWVVDVSGCTVDNVYHQSCIRGDSVLPRVVIPATGHNMHDGVCSYCDKTYTLGLNYFEVGDAYYVSRPSPDLKEWDIIVPPIYNGKPVIGVDVNAFSDSTLFKAVTLPDSVKILKEGAFANSFVEYADLGEGLTTLEIAAFYHAEKLQKLVLPDSVTSIGERCFNGCYALKELTLSKNAPVINGNVFIDCDALENVKIGDGATNMTVADGVLYNRDKTVLIYYPAAKKDVSFVVPETVTEIAPYAFYRQKNLQNITFGSKVTVIGENSFRRSSLIKVSFADGSRLNTIGKDGFGECTSLTEFACPDTVSVIGSGAFYGCEKLSSFAIPTGISIIEEDTFGKCKSLKEIILPDNVKTVRLNAFSECEKVERIDLGSVVTLEEGAFDGCALVTSIAIPDTVTSNVSAAVFSLFTALKEYVVQTSNEKYTAIEGVLYSKDGGTLVSFPSAKSAAGFVLPDAVKKLGMGAFAFSKSITSLTLGANVTEIGTAAFVQSDIENITILGNVTAIEMMTFFGCKKLTAFNVPKSVKIIDDSAFAECDSLTSVTFAPQSELVKIVDEAFSGCGKLSDIDLSGLNAMTEIGGSAFINCTSLKTVVIPSGVSTIGIEAYMNSGVTSLTIQSSSVDLSINKRAFFHTEITALNIPVRVVLIGEEAFAGCEELTAITVDFGNKYYSSDQGILYDKGFTELMLVPAKIDITTNIVFVLKDSVKTIASYAFYKTTFSEVTFNAELKKIGSCSFYGCEALTTVNQAAGSKLESIGEQAFFNCVALKEFVVGKSVTHIEGLAFGQCDLLTLKCEQEYKPDTWQADWNSSDRPVEWNYKGN